MAVIVLTLAPVLAIALTLVGGTSPLTLDAPATAPARITLVPAGPLVLTAVAELLRGPQGLPGIVANRYRHTQTIAAAVWTVPHNLGLRPAVMVVDHLGQQIYPDVVWLDNDIVQVTHGGALRGDVYCS